MEVKTKILETLNKMPVSVQKELLNYAEYLKQKYNLEIEEKQNSNEIMVDFRTSWHEAMTGQTISVSQLWEELEAE